jgi:hypothetical protein
MAIKGSVRRRAPARRIAKLLSAVEAKLNANEMKCSVGDFIRLLEAQEEFDRDTPRDIEVTWVDSLKESNESEQ